MKENVVNTSRDANILKIAKNTVYELIKCENFLPIGW